MKTYLALGDSYTIGEQVVLSQSFPYQLVQLLRNKNSVILAPEIIAKTGWTTDELLDAISTYAFLPTYDFVSLLIGVNNQYRGKAVEEYEVEFEILLKQAIVFAGNKSTNVFVLSIPDWGKTPFAKESDTAKVALEIDNYNAACKKIALKYDCNFIDVTTSQRVDADNTEMLASDGLHPSGNEYKKWADQLANVIISHHSF
jgi:lysophospholipase L1-like esterase